jgi:peptidoglycan hydrolase CwlO-like protein
MTANTQNFSVLEKELESARTNLKDLNENIKRIYGKQDNFQKYFNRKILTRKFLLRIL